MAMAQHAEGLVPTDKSKPYRPVYKVFDELFSETPEIGNRIHREYNRTMSSWIEAGKKEKREGAIDFPGEELLDLVEADPEFRRLLTEYSKRYREDRMFVAQIFYNFGYSFGPVNLTSDKMASERGNAIKELLSDRVMDLLQDEEILYTLAPNRIIALIIDDAAKGKDSSVPIDIISSWVSKKKLTHPLMLPGPAISRLVVEAFTKPENRKILERILNDKKIRTMLTVVGEDESWEVTDKVISILENYPNDAEQRLAELDAYNRHTAEIRAQYNYGPRAGAHLLGGGSS